MYSRRILNQSLKFGQRWTPSIVNNQPQNVRCNGTRQELTIVEEASNRRWNSKTQLKWFTPVLGLAGVIGLSFYYKRLTREGIEDDVRTSVPDEADATDDLPEFSLAEIQKHKTLEEGVWVIFDRNVYDITEFVEGHPGGEKIMLAAGGLVEPFWDIYTLHKTEEVKEILDTMLIGRINESEVNALKVTLPKPYQNDPQRHPAFVINSMTPFDAETPPELLVDSFKTPNDIFYVRNHLPVPTIKEKDYRLEVEIPGSNQTTLTLEDLKTKFEKQTIVATMQCAGNRRRDMGRHRKIYGANGGHTAISTAEWGGVLLRDVLLQLGLDENNGDIKHIQFEGYDQDIAGEHYGASVPIEIAMCPTGDVMLAYEMNGEDIPPDHGYPVRVVVPGVIGARNVKWLRTIKASKDENASFFQKKDYRITPPSADWNTFDFYSEEAHAIYFSPVQSAICTPQDGTTFNVEDDFITIRGYAFSGGGNGILRVDVSIDGGEIWQSANLLRGTKQPLHKNWAWVLWEAAIPVPENITGKIEICCKAMDTFHNSQPENVSGIWNLRGFLNNSWHRISINIKKDESSE